MFNSWLSKVRRTNLQCFPFLWYNSSRWWWCLVAQLCPILCGPHNPMDCSPPGSSVHGILQARILEWVATCFSRESSQSRGQTHVSCIGRWVLYHWVTWEAHNSSTRADLELSVWCRWMWGWKTHIGSQESVCTSSGAPLTWLTSLHSTERYTEFDLWKL